MRRTIAKLIRKRAGLYKMPRHAYRKTKRGWNNTPWNKRHRMKRLILAQIERRLGGQNKGTTQNQNIRKV